VDIFLLSPLFRDLRVVDAAPAAAGSLGSGDEFDLASEGA